MRKANFFTPFAYKLNKSIAWFVRLTGLNKDLKVAVLLKDQSAGLINLPVCNADQNNCRYTDQLAGF
jgi:hypothetical protein